MTKTEDAGSTVTSDTNSVGSLPLPLDPEARVAEIERLSRLYEALSGVNQAIVRAATRAELFEQVCRVLTERGGFGLAWVGWHEPQTQALVPVAKWGTPTEYLDEIRVYADDRPEGRGPTGTAFREGRAYVGNDILDEPGVRPWRDRLERHGLRASAAFPIRERGVVSGTLSVYANARGFFQDKEVRLLSEAVDDISFALDNQDREAARVQADQTLRRERDFSDAVLNSLPGVLYLYDRNGRFLRWNQNFERTTGYSREEIARMHPLDFFTESDMAVVANRIDEVFQSGSASVDAGLRSKSGRVIPHRLTGLSTQIDGETCLIGVGIDISDGKRAEEERATSEARYRALFEYAPDGIVIANADSRYVDANASICRMLGYSRDELVGLHASDIVVPENLAQIGPAVETIQARLEYHQEWRFRRKDGSTFPAEVIATLLPDGNLLGMIRDITERRAAEALLRQANEELEQRVEARTEELRSALVRAEAADRVKSSFLATMSHELRTPLNSIIGFTAIVLQGMAGPLTAEQTKQLSMVRSSARHLLALINDVLDLSKIEAGQLEVNCEPFDLRASIELVMSSMTPLADKKGLTLRAVIAPELGLLHSDRRRVEQILLNLLSNAIKFTTQGGVELSAQPTSIIRAAGAPTALASGAVRIAIADSGIGIAVDDLASLFQPFRQLDSGLTRQHEGTGLGLAICRRLANLLYGEITVSSERSKGSTFCLTLPLRETDAAHEKNRS